MASDLHTIDSTNTNTNQQRDTAMHAFLEQEERLLHQQLQRQQQANQRKQRKASVRRTAVIPWELLDRLDGERQRFENEKAYTEYNSKY